MNCVGVRMASTCPHVPRAAAGRPVGAVKQPLPWINLHTRQGHRMSGGEGGITWARRVVCRCDRAGDNVRASVFVIRVGKAAAAEAAENVRP
ncbi:hypothetical protein BHE74_00014421 [Ensete ventricosum]|nr:hypothetical protein BHE74_00014421 [Ensete ventricosum]